jgi:hypothetical protein
LHRKIQLIKTKTPLLLSAALAVVGILCTGPARAETKTLVIGKYVSSAAFPCVPQQKKQLLAKTEVGDIFFTSLTCSQGDSAYVLGMSEYPTEFLNALSVEEILDSTLDDARSKSHMKIKSSARMTYEHFPAMRTHLVDSRNPQMDSIITATLAGRNMVVIQVTAPPGSAQSEASANFMNSLKISALKK